MQRVAVDASVLINFLIVGKVGLLGALPGLEFFVPEQVRAEVRRPAQVQLLDQELEAGSVQALGDMAPDELVTYGSLRGTFGPGESACLAVAAARGWLVACDERRGFPNRARQLLGEGRLLTTPALLVLTIRGGQLSVAEADRIKARLETARFKMPFESFGDHPDVKLSRSVSG